MTSRFKRATVRATRSVRALTSGTIPFRTAEQKRAVQHLETELKRYGTTRFFDAARIESALASVTRAPHASAVPALVQTVERADQSSTTSVKAIHALGAIDHPVATQALAQIGVSSADQLARVHAWKALGQRATKLRLAVPSVLRHVNPISRRLAFTEKRQRRQNADLRIPIFSLGALGPAGHQAARDLLTTRDRFVRPYAAMALGHARDAKSFYALAKALHDKDGYVQLQAAISLMQAAFAIPAHAQDARMRAVRLASPFHVEPRTQRSATNPFVDRMLTFRPRNGDGALDLTLFQTLFSPAGNVALDDAQLDQVGKLIQRVRKAAPTDDVKVAAANALKNPTTLARVMRQPNLHLWLKQLAAQRPELLKT